MLSSRASTTCIRIWSLHCRPSHIGRGFHLCVD